MATEVRFFGGLSLYALIVGAGYWFSSDEAAGTVLLLGFGLTTGVAFVFLRRGQPRPLGAPETADVPYPGRPDGPFGDESAPLPTRSAAPLVVGFGVAVMALAGAFGPWFLVTGAIPFLIGAVDWLRSVGLELHQRDRADVRSAAELPDKPDTSERSVAGPKILAARTRLAPAVADTPSSSPMPAHSRSATLSGLLVAGLIILIVVAVTVAVLAVAGVTPQRAWDTFLPVHNIDPLPAHGVAAKPDAGL